MYRRRERTSRVSHRVLGSCPPCKQRGAVIARNHISRSSITAGSTAKTQTLLSESEATAHPTAIVVELAPDDVRYYPTDVSLLPSDAVANFPEHARLVEVYGERFGLGLVVVGPDSPLWRHIGGDEVKMVYLEDPETAAPYGNIVSDVVFERVGGGSLAVPRLRGQRLALVACSSRWVRRLRAVRLWLLAIG